MVRWRELVLAMQEAGVTEFVEFGGKVLAGMVKRIAPDADHHQRRHDGRHRGAGEIALDNRREWFARRRGDAESLP